jgi:peptidoglycan/LPS O-acetylase OafA/YrhL
VLLIFGLLYPSTRLGNAGTNLEQVAYHALLLFNFVQQTLWGINPSFWYVATEIQLCLPYPFVLFGIRRIGWTCTLAALQILELGTRVANSAYTLLTVLCTAWQPAGVLLPLGFAFTQ